MIQPQSFIEVKDYDTESAKEGYLNGNYTITFPADSSEDTDSSLSMLENFALVLDLNSAKDSGSVALSVESAGSTLSEASLLLPAQANLLKFRTLRLWEMFMT